MKWATFSTMGGYGDAKRAVQNIIDSVFATSSGSKEFKPSGKYDKKIEGLMRWDRHLSEPKSLLEHIKGLINRVEIGLINQDGKTELKDSIYHYIKAVIPSCFSHPKIEKNFRNETLKMFLVALQKI